MEGNKLSLYRLLKLYKSSKNKDRFFKENHIYCRVLPGKEEPSRLIEIIDYKRVLKFDEGIIMYYAHDDLHSVYFKIN